MMEGDDDNTPRKRKSRHSINVFQGGSMKASNTDEEEQPIKIKKRKSMAARSVSNNNAHQSPPQQVKPQQTTINNNQQPQPQPQLQLQHPKPEHQQPQHQQSQQPQHQPQPQHVPQPQINPQIQANIQRYILPPQASPQWKPVQPFPKPQYVRNPMTQPPSQYPPSSSSSSSVQPAKKSTYTPYPSYLRQAAEGQQPQVPEEDFDSKLPPALSPAPQRAVPASPLPPPPPPLTPSTLSRFAAPKTVPSPPKTEPAPKPKPIIRPQRPDPSQSRKSKPSILPHLFTFAMIVLWALALASVSTSIFKHLTATYRFCDFSPSSDESVVPPQCIPCPPNGVCRGGKLECNTKFVRRGMICIEDHELNLMAEDMAEKINEELMLAAGNYKCGTAPHDYITSEELQEALNNTGRYPVAKFNDAFVEALSKMSTDPRYEFTATGTRFSTTRVKYSWTCVVKLLFYRQLPYIVMVLAAVCLGITIRIARRKAVQRSVEVSIAVARVLSDLQAKKESSNSGIVVEHLRDKLLHGRDKANMWLRVVSIVQADSRVIEYASFINGAQATSWEWVGC